MVSAYVRAGQTMGIPANIQRIFHDKDTATRFFKPVDWVLYWNKPNSLQTLSSGGCTRHFVIEEKVTHVNCTIQFAPDSKKKIVHCDEFQMDPCNEDRRSVALTNSTKVAHNCSNTVWYRYPYHSRYFV